MKKFMLVLLVMLFFVSFVGASGGCMRKCGEEKVASLESIDRLKADFRECRPSLLQCLQGEETLVSCREGYSECKWSAIKGIREKTIDMNVKYNSCMKACRTEPKEEMLGSDVVVSGVCLDIKNAQEQLIFHLGLDGFEKVLGLNGCEKVERNFL